jgi:hypothetical protein
VEVSKEAPLAPGDGVRSDTANDERAGEAQLRDSPMMAHLIEALEAGTDVGHYGRLVFTMIARHFLNEEELIDLLQRQPDQTETRARALVTQVREKGYSPPKRERILEWQGKQDFPICPTPEDPDSCNVYRELRFPEEIYEGIQEYWEEQVEAEEQG